MRLRAPLAVVLAVSGALAAATPAQEGRINLAPSRAEGIAAAGTRIGPLTIRNTSTQPYRVSVFPALLGQDRGGGLKIRDSAPDLKRAKGFVEAQFKRFPLVPGAERGTLARVAKVPAAGSLYAGLVFEARPVRRPGQGARIQNVLQIVGQLIFDPPPEKRRYRVTGEAATLRAREDRRLELVLPVTNGGNVFTRIAATVRIADASGREVLEQKLTPIKTLPRTTVELAAPVTNDLPKGKYRATAEIRMAGTRPAESEGEIELFADNQVRTQNAQIKDIESPVRYDGDGIEISARFRNTGNVPFKPRAEVELRAQAGDQRLLGKETADVEEAQPGEEGTISAKFDQKGKAGETYAVTVRLFDGKRPLGERVTTFQVQPKRGFGERLGDFFQGNAALLFVLLLAALAIAGFFVLRYVRRLKESGPSPTARSGPPAPGAAPDAAAGAVDINTASRDELMTLPGVGRVAAERIVAFRDEYGRLRSFDDLRRVEGFDDDERIRAIAEHARL